MTYRLTNPVIESATADSKLDLTYHYIFDDELLPEFENFGFWKAFV